ncbi:uncharacterized protein PV06_05670 [Exophiala oligosperma]|uniref:BRCT domain-containing protein n=1 Tax=Exophiala oligosperma TaxID=215243 RepID=A0A0D2AQ80_9EURO|nr:uncharacterized protein PV06_05670 [Exophiala oligosperma]KIW42086.1 hypothetical protein PV06_05670 [Exophiala oligosperma]
MAPRKPASPAKPRRVTRARAADTAATPSLEEAPKRKTATTSKAVPKTTKAKAIESKSRVSKKTETKRAKATRRSTPVVEGNGSDDDEDEITVAAAQTQLGTTRAARSTRTTTSNASASTSTSTLAAAPRRRIKVTPLDAAVPEPEPQPAKKTAAKEKKEKSTTTAATTKSAAMRAKRNVTTAKGDEKSEEPEVEHEPKRRGRSTKAATKAEPEKVTSEPITTVRKTRGRAKKEDTAVEPVEPASAPVTTRQTRARSGSTASATAAGSAVNVVIPAPTRKRVTFQDLPEDDEDDEKENKQPITTSRAKGVKKGPVSSAAATKKAETNSKGMRAKPIRKPAATTKSTRGTTRATKASKAAESETEKVMPRVLTPKKITQVAKAAPVDSDDEDELAGDKTPVRDLSLSPKRGHVSPIRPMSPVKTLDFTPALQSPEKQRSNTSPGLMSPPRRMPSSPFKDILKESPRRAPEGVTIFRAQIQDSHNNNSSLALNPKNQQQLLQSPKRGLADTIVFPPSAMKSKQSPLKSALMSSPARRLFSPSKQKTPARFSPSPVKKQATPVEQTKSPGDVDIVMSSHFRPSMSPQRGARVYKMSDEEIAQETMNEMDFDQSVLNIRSPLKADKVKPVAEMPDEDLELRDSAAPNEDRYDADDAVIEPGSLVPADDLETDGDSEADNDETVLDTALVEQGTFDEEMEDGTVQEDALTEASENENTPQPIQQVSSKKLRLPNALFHRLRDIDDESEDELASDQTPVVRSRPNASGVTLHSRLSTGIAPPSASRGLGFTPLVAQVRDWRAASPEKRMSSTSKTPISDVVFSPLAQVHVAGSVEVNRQDTPAKQAQKRKSVAARLSFASSSTGSPAQPDFFGEGMAAQEFEEQTEELAKDPAQEEDLHQIMQQQGDTEGDENADESLEEGQDDDSEVSSHEPGELTTDLIKFTNASDTAMVDFKALANEAEGMADGEAEATTDDEELEPTVLAHRLSMVEEEHSVLSNSSENYGDENSPPRPAAAAFELDEPVPESESHESADTEIIGGTVIGDASTSVAISPSAVGLTPMAIEKSIEMDFDVTPIRPDPNATRVVHTVAKVPLRPEGEIPATSSPIKMQRKRPRSLSTSNSLSAKRRSLALGGPIDTAIISAMRAPVDNGSETLSSSPQRRIRSAAPSPAYTLSTAFSTPGQYSFAVEDFGDSTLDGIELPEEEMSSDLEIEDHQEETETAQPTANDDTMMTIGSYIFKTPAPSVRTARTSMLPPPSTVMSVAANTTTPSYARSTNSSRRKSISTPSHAASDAVATPAPATTPATVSKSRSKTPSTSLKSKTPARTPLKAISDGPLNGAVVHCDIHTSEGSDASAIYVDLLTAMGARCVKEWRWNPRAAQNEAAETPGHNGQVIGITHVIYKDGGKRTLEKVRSAGGQVLCVGVAWVLECHRKQSWVDEGLFSVDTGIMPRGGSRRRKSMEPRMLKNEGGHLSSKKRKSLPASHFTYQDANVSACKNVAAAQHDEEDEISFRGAAAEEARDENSMDESNVDLDTSVMHADDEQDDDSVLAGHDESEGEISSAYNSPAAATAGETMQFYELPDALATSAARDESLSSSPSGSMTGPSRSKTAINTRTPRSEKVDLNVDYDPRTAATPLTPYVRSKGVVTGVAGTGVGVGSGTEKMMMSAPPKQTGRSLFDDGDDDDDNLGEEKTQKRTANDRGNGDKFRLKLRGTRGGGVDRRRTLAVGGGGGANGLGFRPVVGSPLRKE